MACRSPKQIVGDRLEGQAWVFLAEGARKQWGSKGSEAGVGGRRGLPGLSTRTEQWMQKQGSRSPPAPSPCVGTLQLPWGLCSCPGPALSRPPGGDGVWWGKGEWGGGWRRPGKRRPGGHGGGRWLPTGGGGSPVVAQRGWDVGHQGSLPGDPVPKLQKAGRGHTEAADTQNA